MRRQPRAPRMFGRDVDPDAWTPRDRSHRQAAILDVQTRAKQIGVVLRERDSHGFRQVPRTPAEILVAGGHAATAPHHLDSINWIERANEHRRRRPARLCDDVHHPVDAIIEVYVSVSRLAVHRRIPRRRARRRVTGGIRFADVRLDFDDRAARADAAPIVDEHLAEEIAGDVEGGALVEGSG